MDERARWRRDVAGAAPNEARPADAGERALRRSGERQLARDDGGPTRVAIKVIERTTTRTEGATRSDKTSSISGDQFGVARTSSGVGEEGEESAVAVVEELGRQLERAPDEFEAGAGGGRTTSVSTIAAQSSQSRIVVALLRDGAKLELKIQEMRPGVFEVGASLAECRRFRDEHARLVRNLGRQEGAPLASWMAKFRQLEARGPAMTGELRRVYMSMADNLQGCWRGLMAQLEQRLALLEETCKFYQSVERLLKALERADEHVQVHRQDFLAGPAAARFAQASGELRRMNEEIAADFLAAKTRQARLVELIGRLAMGNLGDARANLLLADGQALIDFVRAHLEPLERRKLQLASVITSTSARNETRTLESDEVSATRTRRGKLNAAEPASRPETGDAAGERRRDARAQPSGAAVREIGNFNDLNLVEGWLDAKVEQLNSSLLSSLGVSAQDARSILNKHEQIALECAAIEGAALKFEGRNIHASRAPGEEQPAGGETNRLFERQRQLATRARNVIAILDARLVLLRRAIDFYARARAATGDIARMLRRLQVDNSLQSVQLVADELELRDVSAVVASGATILSELQQLQLAQAHGQRSQVVSLNLITGGVRASIDQLNQELAHLKTVLNQRRLVLLNEDASKMAQNFSNKCHQLKFWLDNHVKGQLLASNRLACELEGARAFCAAHEQLRQQVRNKTLEVEALLRLLATLTENFGAKSETAGELQRETDELRQEWIGVTNCLERRLELARNYLAILAGLAEAGAELEQLERLAAGGGAQEARTAEELRLGVERALERLAPQVERLGAEAAASQTALAHAQPLEARANTSDLNKQQIVGHANGALKLLRERLKTALGKLNARGPRKWPMEAGAASGAASSAATTSTTTTTTTTETRTTLEAGQTEGEPPAATTTTTTTTTPAANARPEVARKRRGSIQVAPRFLVGLRDLDVEPFSSVTLECELDPASTANLAGNHTQQVKVEWLLNNKRIPASIKHSTASETNRHRLLISQFGPTCCGTLTARATNQLNGQTASSSCRLRLAGIREVDDAAESTAARAQTGASLPRPPPGLASPAGSTTSSFSTWRPGLNDRWQQQQQQQRRQVSKERALERIIQGVESPASHAGDLADKTGATLATAEGALAGVRLPLTEATYNGQLQQQQQRQQHARLNYIDSPSAGAAPSSLGSRSISRSPLDGTPQPAAIMGGLSDSLAHVDSRAGLVCVVMGNPPPQVEWLHEGRPVASARCARAPGQPRANLCKLTIETLDDKTRGQYVCRATNKLGQSSAALTLAK